MAANYPNPIPIYISGDKSTAYPGPNITSSLTDQDGDDAVGVVTLDTNMFALFRRVTIYSRGSNNGAGTAYVWVDFRGQGVRSCIAQKTWTAPTGRGIVAEIDIVDFDATDDGDKMKGVVLGGNSVVYIQIQDASMSDGYRATAFLRDLTYIDGLNTVD